MTKHDDDAIGALEAATRALQNALEQQPDPDVDAAMTALEARSDVLALIAQGDAHKRSPEQAERLVRVLERDVEMSRTLESQLAAIRDRVAALERLKQRLTDEAAARSSTAGPAAGGSQTSGVSPEEAARAYGRTPTT